MSWLANGACAGDVLVLYFNGYRTLVPENTSGVMVSEDGQEIAKEELVQHLHSHLPSGCRLTCLFDYQDRVDGNMVSDGSQKLIEKDPFSSPYQFSKKQEQYLQLEEFYPLQADIRTLALKGQHVAGEDHISRNPLGLSFAAAMARHPGGVLVPALLDEMEGIARLRGFKNVKPVLASTQYNDLNQPFT